MACRPTSGASPAITSCAATRWRSSAGTGCIPAEPEKRPLHPDGARRDRRPHHRRHRLHEGCAGPVVAVAAEPAGHAGHRRLRTQRQSPALCGSTSRVNAESIAAAALSRLARDGKFDAQRAPEGVRGTGCRHREDRSRDRLARGVEGAQLQAAPPVYYSGMGGGLPMLGLPLDTY